jgi:hypothetical protein
MTDQEHLERSYRRLLGWYPQAFRREKGPEILAVLLACAWDGQRRPRLAEAADLIRGGLWMRLRPAVPRSARTVRAAVRLLGAGAAITAVNLIISLNIMMARMAAIKAAIREWNPWLTAAQVSQGYTSAIVVGIVSCLVPVAVWLWMAQANGRGRNWARILFTVLFGLATLTLIFPESVIVPQWVPIIGNHPVVIGYVPGGTDAFRPGGRPDRAGADRAGGPGRGVPAVAPGLQRVLPVVAGLPAGPAPGAQDRSRADPVVRGTAPASAVSRAGQRADAGWPGVRRTGRSTPEPGALMMISLDACEKLT